MKLFIASDIHGSAYYCEKMLNAFKNEKADKLILLGDILYHGPRNDLPEGYDTRKVAALLNEYASKIIGVRGNCDCDIDQVMLDFPMMADELLLYINGRSFFVTHGHLYNEEKLPPLNKGDFLLHGHTHVSIINKHDNYTYINPGSVSMPKSDTPNSYLIIDDKGLYWKNLEGKVYKEYLFD